MVDKYDHSCNIRAVSILSQVLTDLKKSKKDIDYEVTCGKQNKDGRAKTPDPMDTFIKEGSY